MQHGQRQHGAQGFLFPQGRALWLPLACEIHPAAACCGKQCADKRAIQYGIQGVGVGISAELGNGGHQINRQRQQAGNRLLLAQAEYIHQRGFQRPSGGCPLLVERQGYRQGDE